MKISEVSITSDNKIGEGVLIIKPVNIYGADIGDNCKIGPFVEFQKDSKIGKNTKIQSHSFICELVTIGDDCFVGHGVMFINDTFAEGKNAGGDKTKWKKTYIANRVYIGSNATILPVNICEDVIIGAGAVVTKDIIKPGFYVGNPAKFLKNK